MKEQEMINTQKIRSIEELKEGDKIIIQKEPTLGSSQLNPNFYFHILTFPYILTIRKIELIANQDYSYIAMTCGNYGWDLESIIEAGCKKIIEDIPLNKLIEEYRRLL